ncbi:MAG: tellurite resistance TerB family protein [Hyphomicrobium sp.]
MFDAKSLLESLVKGAGAPQASQAPAGGGGLADILGQILQGAGGGQASGRGGGQAAGGQGDGGLADILGQLQRGLQPQGGGHGASQDGGLGGGLGDILGQLQGKLGQPSNNAVEGPSGGAGGLGDILGQLKDQLGQGGGAAQGGGLMDILGQVLAQAASGVKEGAGRIDSATGASDALGKATGQSPADILAKLQELVKDNPLAAGGAMGGLGGLVLGTKTGRSAAASAAKIGALALIGGLAYKAFENYQAGRPLITGALAPQAAPQGSGFEPAAVTNQTAALYIRTMIAAAAADGRIDAAEQAKIVGGLKQAGLDAEAEQFLADAFNNPVSVDDLAAAVSSPEEAVQVYTAARIAIEPDTAQEKNFLANLAGALGVDNKLAAHIDATARSASA